jgi:hypothetical protein
VRVPSPVTTTRRVLIIRALNAQPRGTSARGGGRPGLFGLLVLDVLYDIAHAEKFLGIAVRNFHAKLFFESHDELDDVERVGPEVFDKLGLWGYLLGVDAELFDDDVFNFLIGVFFAHSVGTPVFVRSAVRILGGN